MNRYYLKAARNSKRRTGLEAATAIGISEGRYFRIETGRTPPTVEEMARLADYLGFAVATIFPDASQGQEGAP